MVNPSLLTPGAINRFRKEKGLSQQDLATVLGAGVATVSRWENGEAQPTRTAAAVLTTVVAAALGDGAPGASRTLGVPQRLCSGYAIYQLLKAAFEHHAAP